MLHGLPGVAVRSDVSDGIRRAAGPNWGGIGRQICISRGASTTHRAHRRPERGVQNCFYATPPPTPPHAACVRTCVSRFPSCMRAAWRQGMNYVVPPGLSDRPSDFGAPQARCPPPPSRIAADAGQSARPCIHDFCSIRTCPRVGECRHHPHHRPPPHASANVRPRPVRVSRGAVWQSSWEEGVEAACCLCPRAPLLAAAAVIGGS